MTRITDADLHVPWIQDIWPQSLSPHTCTAPKGSTWTFTDDAGRQITLSRFLDSTRPRCDATLDGSGMNAVCGLLPRHDGPHVSVHKQWEHGRLVAEIAVTRRVECGS